MQTDNTSPSTSAAWSLAKGQTQTIRPQTAGWLRATSGRVWVTLGTPSTSPQPRWCPAMEPGDIFLRPGSSLRIKAGEVIVIESWPVEADAISHLAWEPMEPSAHSAHWQQAVVKPAREMVQGLVVLSGAMARLVMGLAGYAEYLVAGRGKVQTCMESNAP